MFFIAFGFFYFTKQFTPEHFYGYLFCFMFLWQKSGTAAIPVRCPLWFLSNNTSPRWAGFCWQQTRSGWWGCGLRGRNILPIPCPSDTVPRPRPFWLRPSAGWTSILPARSPTSCHRCTRSGQVFNNRCGKSC